MENPVDLGWIETKFVSNVSKFGGLLKGWRYGEYAQLMKENIDIMHNYTRCGIQTAQIFWKNYMI